MAETRAEVHRWRRLLYRGRRPHRLARLLNRAQAALAARGIGPSRIVVLEVVGRRTGRIVSLPVVVADLDGERYLVSMLGEGTNWVRNVRAAHGRAVLRHRRRSSSRRSSPRAGRRSCAGTSTAPRGAGRTFLSTAGLRSLSSSGSRRTTPSSASPRRRPPARRWSPDLVPT